MTNHSAFPLSPQTHHQSSPKAGSPSAFLLDKAWARRPSLCLTVFDPKYALTQMPPPFRSSLPSNLSERKTLEHTSHKYWQIHWRKPAPCEAGQKKQLNKYNVLGYMSRCPSQSLNHTEVVRVRTLEWLTQVAPVASNRMRNLAEFLPPGYMTNCFWEATSGDKETTHKIKAINNAESIAKFLQSLPFQIQHPSILKTMWLSSDMS